MEPAHDRSAGHGPGGAGTQPGDEKKEAELVDAVSLAAKRDPQSSYSRCDQENRAWAKPVNQSAPNDQGYGVPDEKAGIGR